MAGRKIVLVGDLGTDHEGFPPTPVLSGSPDVFMDGKPVARVGDPLAPHAKPHHPPHPRTIASGDPTFLVNGLPVAVTGEAVSCNGVTIGSGSGEIGGGSSPAPSGVSSASATASPTPTGSAPVASDTGAVASGAGLASPADSAGATQKTASAPVGTPLQARSGESTPADHSATGLMPTQSPAPAEPALPNTEVRKRSDQQPPSTALSANTPVGEQNETLTETGEEPARQSPEPGFHVVKEPMTKVAMLEQLYGDASARPDHFDRLNPNLGGRVLPGEMIILGDPEGVECTQEEADLMHVASQVNQQLRTLDESEAQFLVDHYDLLEMLTSNAATGMGAGAVMISNQVKGIESTLRELESLHQETYKKYGHLNSEEFFEKRRALFKKLDFALGNIARKGMSLDDNPKLKTGLGLSTKSIVHNWKQSGVGGIPGYATHYDATAKFARYATRGGVIANFLNAGVSGMKIYEVCAQGSDKECQKVKYTEGGRFSGGVIGGSAGAYAGGLACLALGVTTGAGGVACAIILGGAGSAVGGSVGGEWGEERGEELYRYSEGGR